MGDIRKKNHIKVMNCSTSRVCVEGRNRGYNLPPCRDGIPSVEYMDFEEIEYINSKSPVFRNGDLQFEEDDRNALFDALKYPKWRETYLDEDMLDDILHNPTTENLQAITRITSSATFERLRAKLIKSVNENDDGVSTRVASIINERFRELQNGKSRSTISTAAYTNQPNAVDEVAALRERNENLQRQLDAIMQEIAKMQKSGKSSAKKSAEPKVETESET